MARKILNIVLKILIIIVVYLLQIYVINNTMFFGVNGDLCLMAVVTLTLLKENHIGYIAAVLCGIVSDVLFSTTIGKYLSIYVIVVSVLIGLKKMYKQDSKLAIIVFSVSAVVISETMQFLFNIVSTGQFVNIFTFLLNIFKQCLINIFLTYVLYLAFEFCNKKGE